MKILSLDQALHSGFCIWKDKIPVKYGTKDFSKCEPYSTAINEIKKWILEIVKKEKIEVVAVEDTFLNSFGGKNAVTSFAKLNKLLGVIEDNMLEKEIPCFVIKASEWKSYFKVKGRKREEQKKNTILRVKEVFNIDADEDCADAIGIGYYVVNKVKIK